MTVVDIPADCISIGAHAFRSCAKLTMIRVPAGCAIGTDAFEGCEQVFVYGYTGSSAEAYCAAHENCTFCDLDAIP